MYSRYFIPEAKEKSPKIDLLDGESNPPLPWFAIVRYDKRKSINMIIQAKV